MLTANTIVDNKSKDKTSSLADYRQKWLEKMEFLNSVSVGINDIIFLHDISINGFVYMSDAANVLGDYDRQNFLSETGMDFYFSNIHPEQRTAALMMQLKIISYGIEHPSSDTDKVVFNLTYLYKKMNGSYIQLLQKCIAVESDKAGHPLLYLSYAYDISHIVKPSVGLTINTPDETLIWTFNNHKKSLEQIKLLSNHERKILTLLVQGRSSKEIAEVLFISPNTIDTHRRNFLKKTNCIDTTALIAYIKMTRLTND